MGQITKKEHRAAKARTIAFRKFFKNIKAPNVINLNTWYYEETFGDIDECGSVGCLGGYAENSPMVKRFCDKTCRDKYETDSLFAFFGVSRREANELSLFESSQSPKFGSIPNGHKYEALERLDSVIRLHNEALA